jgi:hypothetical protein
MDFGVGIIKIDLADRGRCAGWCNGFLLHHHHTQLQAKSGTHNRIQEMVVAKELYLRCTNSVKNKNCNNMSGNINNIRNQSRSHKLYAVNIFRLPLTKSLMYK